ncbi:hypothetical protein LUZ63_014913 [Rhynchospora breviuscula]|uniref:DUF4005 domain-containing protein n=1 Tax=Rhynchospora breviuscula TaxID=2022672 RepID=A0A9Q0CBC7_9POAL|nr:hypothetical protein LUZ63_014913 [Rhynchospora breviuscula]
MGKKTGNWLSSVKKVFRSSSSSSPSKDQNKHAERVSEVVEERGNEAAEIVSVEHFPSETSPDVTNDGTAGAADNDEEVEQKERRAIMTAAAEAALVAAEAKARMIRMAAYERAMATSREDRAAVRIQTFYRGYLARRALRALKGLVRLQALVRGHQVRKQVQATMRCMQSLLRAQARVRTRRISLSNQSNKEEKQLTNTKRRYRNPESGNSYIKDIDMKDEKEEIDEEKWGFVNSSNRSPHRYGDWDTRNQSLDAIKMSAQKRHDAVIRRERALAYAYSCQMKEQWPHEREKQQFGWNWLENWMASHQQLVSTDDLDPTTPAAKTLTANNSTTTTNPNIADHLSEKTVEMDASHVPTSDQLFNQPLTIPGYMAATHSARAKVRAELPLPRQRARKRSELGGFGFGLGAESLSSGGRLSPVCVAGLRPVQISGTNEGYSPDSSCVGDERTPPPFGERVSRRVYV